MKTLFLAAALIGGALMSKTFAASKSCSCGTDSKECCCKDYGETCKCECKKK